jgi:hypothetical protein
VSTNSEQIILKVRKEFEGLLRLVCDSSPDKAPTAYDLECCLFRQILSLGCSLLSLYFSIQAEHFHRPFAVDGEGQSLPYHSERTRDYHSAFGKLKITRSCYYARGRSIWYALDAALNLPKSGPSDLLRQWQDLLATDGRYKGVGKTLLDILGLSASTRAVAEQVACDGDQVEAYYDDTSSAPKAVPEATILVSQVDGKGVPLVLEPDTERPVRLGKGQKSGRKKEAVVTAVYTQAPAPRSVDSVMQSLFHRVKDRTTERSHPCNKRLWATLKGKETALRFALKEMAKQDGEHIVERLALTDGAASLQEWVKKLLPAFKLILDFIHAYEYLWEAANALLGENAPERLFWGECRVRQLLSGQTAAVIADLKEIATHKKTKAAAKKALLKTAGYYERNAPYMHYDEYLAAGWPIATGVIEGACRHVVKDRCELSGMRWTKEGAETLLHLRCVEQNGDWADFHAFRRAKRHKEVYGYTAANADNPETVAFNAERGSNYARAA